MEHSEVVLLELFLRTGFPACPGKNPSTESYWSSNLRLAHCCQRPRGQGTLDLWSLLATKHGCSHFSTKLQIKKLPFFEFLRHFPQKKKELLKIHFRREFYFSHTPKEQTKLVWFCWFSRHPDTMAVVNSFEWLLKRGEGSWRNFTVKNHSKRNGIFLSFLFVSFALYGNSQQPGNEWNIPHIFNSVSTEDSCLEFPSKYNKNPPNLCHFKVYIN